MEQDQQTTADDAHPTAADEFSKPAPAPPCTPGGFFLDLDFPDTHSASWERKACPSDVQPAQTPRAELNGSTPEEERQCWGDPNEREACWPFGTALQDSEILKQADLVHHHNIGKRKNAASDAALPDKNKLLLVPPHEENNVYQGCNNVSLESTPFLSFRVRTKKRFLKELKICTINAPNDAFVLGQPLDNLKEVASEDVPKLFSGWNQADVKLVDISDKYRGVDLLRCTNPVLEERLFASGSWARAGAAPGASCDETTPRPSKKPDWDACRESVWQRKELDYDVWQSLILPVKSSNFEEVRFFLIAVLDEELQGRSRHGVGGEPSVQQATNVENHGGASSPPLIATVTQFCPRREFRTYGRPGHVCTVYFDLDESFEYRRQANNDTLEQACEAQLQQARKLRGKVSPVQVYAEGTLLTSMIYVPLCAVSSTALLREVHRETACSSTSTSTRKNQDTILATGVEDGKKERSLVLRSPKGRSRQTSGNFYTEALTAAWQAHRDDGTRYENYVCSTVGGARADRWSVAPGVVSSSEEEVRSAFDAGWQHHLPDGCTTDVDYWEQDWRAFFPGDVIVNSVGWLRSASGHEVEVQRSEDAYIFQDESDPEDPMYEQKSLRNVDESISTVGKRKTTRDQDHECPTPTSEDDKDLKQRTYRAAKETRYPIHIFLHGDVARSADTQQLPGVCQGMLPYPEISWGHPIKYLERGLARQWEKQRTHHRRVFVEGKEKDEFGNYNDPERSSIEEQDRCTKMLAHSVLIMPFCTDDCFWFRGPPNRSDAKLFNRGVVAVMAKLRRIAIDLLQGDARRLYLTGASMGGYGVLELAALWGPEVVAAVVALSPCRELRTNPAQSGWFAERLADIPLWIFHSREDKCCKFVDTLSLVHELLSKRADKLDEMLHRIEGQATATEAAPAPLRFTTCGLPNVARCFTKHSRLTEVMDNSEDVYLWMYQFLLRGSGNNDQSGEGRWSCLDVSRDYPVAPQGGQMNLPYPKSAFLAFHQTAAWRDPEQAR
ncbi:unnamed protein product [Amoebophrya sp. A120]|nr:unnamed protein product [Amoebophrya sp. A120]|eukprot:GSA120T00025359001.1